MAYATVNRTNLGTQGRDNIYELIYTTITDPITNTTSSSRTWIYRRFPDTKARGFKGYPFIVLSYPSMDIDSKCLSHFKMMEFSVMGTVYCKFDYNGKTRNNTLINSIIEQINSGTNQDTLEGYGVKAMDIEFDESDTEVHEQMEVIATPFTIDFDVDIDVEE